MNYTAEHIDVEKFEDGLKDHRDYQMEEKRLTVEKAQAFFDGYEKALDDVGSMLHCCNYESKEKRSATYHAGADNAFYELCKELDISGQDIRDMNTGIDEKAALLAERIRNVLCDEGRTDNGTD